LRLARDEHAEPHELRPRLLAHAIACARCPARHVEIAQAASSRLDLGLEQVERSAKARMPRRGLFLEPHDEIRELTFTEETCEGAVDELGDEGALPSDEP